MWLKSILRPSSHYRLSRKPIMLIAVHRVWAGIMSSKMKLKRCQKSASLRISRIKISMPTNANAVEIPILKNVLICGNNKLASKIPNAALWVVPIIDGSTKRFFSTTCMVIPATATDAPVNTIANVRGRRLVINSCRLLSRPCQIFAHEKSEIPMDTLTSTKPSILINANRLMEKGDNDKGCNDLSNMGLIRGIYADSRL